MLPLFIQGCGSWRTLPPGIHAAKLCEINSQLCFNDHRERLFRGFVKACKMLKKAGCKCVHLGGSFVTEKDYPEDYDVCWMPDDVNLKKLDKSFFDRDAASQKKKYLGEFYPSVDQTGDGCFYVDYFRKGKNGEEKGVIAIHLFEDANKIYCGL